MSKEISIDIENESVKDNAMQRERNQAAIELLREWMADESGYDETVWPVVKKSLEENRLSYRERFDD